VKPIQAWAICHWKGGIYEATIRRTRKEAIQAYIENYDVNQEDVVNKNEPNYPAKVVVYMGKLK